MKLPDRRMGPVRPRGPRPAEAPADAHLLDRVAQGDIGAFESLFHRYRPRLRRYLDRRTRRPELVDEIVNDTMLVVWRRAGSFDLRSCVSTWIIGIAHRVGLKATATARHSSEETADEGMAPLEDAPEHRVAQRELSSRLVEALRSLSPEHRAVIELAYFKGLSCREIAGLLGCPTDTVKTRMFHARRRLKVLLAHLAEDAA
jgi:RNA polymerase sigma-70 factor (ECF subfamily)